MQVVYDPDNRPNRFNKSITVTSNARVNQIRLKISGNVIPTPNKLRSSIGLLRLNKTKFSFRDLTNTDIETGPIELHNTYKDVAQITIETEQPYLKISPSFFELRPNERVTIKYTFDAVTKNDFGNFIEKIPVTVQTTLKRKKGFIYFTGHIKEDFSALTPEQRAAAPVIELNSSVIDLGEIKLESQHLLEVPVSNKGETPLLIHKIETGRYCSLIEFDKSIEPDSQGTIKLEVVPQIKRSSFYTDFTIICNDPQNPVHKVRISGKSKN